MKQKHQAASEQPCCSLLFWEDEFVSSVEHRPGTEQLQSELRQQVHAAEKEYLEAVEKYKQAIKEFRQPGASFAVLQAAAAESIALEKYTAALKAFTDSVIPCWPPNSSMERGW